MKNITLTQRSLEDLRQIFREEINGLSTHSSKSPSDSSASKELLTPAEASLYLKLALSTIYNMVHKRAIPHIKKGKKLYFAKDELNEWVLAGRQLTQDALNEIAKAHLAQLTTKRRWCNNPPSLTSRC